MQLLLLAVEQALEEVDILPGYGLGGKLALYLAVQRLAAHGLAHSRPWARLWGLL